MEARLAGAAALWFAAAEWWNVTRRNQFAASSDPQRRDLAVRHTEIEIEIDGTVGK